MSTARRRIGCILGTRPEAVKVAPLVIGLAATAEFEPVVMSTGQHREMLRQVLDIFGIEPHVDLDLLSPGQSLADVAAAVISRFTPMMADLSLDAVVVQGDTTTTFAGALAATYNRVPVVHLEAGLRTGDRYSPFPEELNRRMTTQLAALHLAPTSTSAGNLIAEGVDPATVVVTGNTVIDALHMTAKSDASEDPELCRQLLADPRRLLLVTAHRRESWGAPMASIGRGLARLARERDDLVVLFPIHRNPTIRDVIEAEVSGIDNVVVTEPLDYGAFCRMMQRADVIVTDSGGVQEEAPSLGTPVLVVRDNTERPEAVAAGTVRLVGTDDDRIVKEVGTLLDDPVAHAAMANVVNPYGDGHAVPRCVASMRRFFGDAVEVDEFDPFATAG